MHHNTFFTPLPRYMSSLARVQQMHLLSRRVVAIIAPPSSTTRGPAMKIGNRRPSSSSSSSATPPSPPSKPPRKPAKSSKVASSSSTGPLVNLPHVRSTQNISPRGEELLYELTLANKQNCRSCHSSPGTGHYIRFHSSQFLTQRRLQWLARISQLKRE